MKTTFFVLALSFLMISCVDYYEEPVRDQRDKFMGTYEVEEYSTTYHDKVFYRMFTTRGYRSYEILLHDFYEEDLVVVAEVWDNTITIPYQVVDGYEIQGTGSYYSGEMYLDYSVYDRYSRDHRNYCETVAYKL